LARRRESAGGVSIGAGLRFRESANSDVLRELGVDIAALVEPFVRAISEFSADQESVAPDRFRRAYPSRQKPTVKTHGRAITAS
jgi:hypothetical protein